MRNNKWVCVVLALVLVGGIVITDDSDVVTPASGSPTLGAISAGSAMIAQAGEPTWWPGWNGFFGAIGAVAVAVERWGDWVSWWGGGSYTARMDYSGVSEAVFD